MSVREFESACDGMLDAIRKAADPSLPEWAPYIGNCHLWAVYATKAAVRRARQLGLYPSTAALAHMETMHENEVYARR